MRKCISLQMNISGCSTTCMHCWAQDGHYDCMPIEDVGRVLDAAADYCNESSYGLHVFPMNEILDHPEVEKALRKLRKILEIDGGYQLDPFPANGVSLGSRDDWKHILGAVKELGTTYVCFSLHGMDEVHDRIVNRKGAFGLVCSAIERTHAAGLECHCNVFLTKDNTCQFSEILDTLKSLGVERTSFSPADYQPTRRGRKHEQIRPELGDLSPLADRAYEYETFSGVRKIWADLLEYTEGRCVSKALKSTKEYDDKVFSQVDEESVSLVCLSNLDVYTGIGSYLGEYHGNLRNDGIRKVLSKAVDSEPVNRESLYFSTDTDIPTEELARDYGNVEGQKVYFGGIDELRTRWLDMALKDYRRY